jgi:hypothetical protein
MNNSETGTKFQSASLRTRGRQSPENRATLRAGLEKAKLAKKHEWRPDFVRHQRKKAPKPSRIIAYDFETTPIAVGTPRPLYLTAYSPEFHFEQEIRNRRDCGAMQHLHDILVTHFLTEAHLGVKFVAWNGNRFDAYFIAGALVFDPRFRLRPFLTKSKALRGLKVTLAEHADDPKAPGWEFLDGIAMLGLAGVKLEKLLENFAPDHKKLTGTIDFEGGEEFDARNPKHREYAMRDSIGLWYAMDHAQRIMLDTFGEPLAVTMGGVCIRIFAANIPPAVEIKPLIPDVDSVVRSYVMRGGYCYITRKYHGPVWKYDLNQAYAAAMRESQLPCGELIRGAGMPNTKRPCYIVRLIATKPGNRVPFYHRAEILGRIKSCFSIDTIPDTWVTSIEHRQLIAEGWQIKCIEHWTWAGSFDMREFVDKLETLRTTCDGGPAGPIGTMVKATGNHSFGKTAEKIEPLEYVLADECPEDCLPFYGDGDDPLEHVFYRFDLTQRPKNYHKPQLAAFITAHCRMVLRRAILIKPESWLYADTDCVVFDSDVTASLDIHPKRYGAWKVEEAGTEYMVIAKKVYAEIGGDKPKRSAKGLHVRKLTEADFRRWYEGEAPEQDQVQINNFLAMLDSAEMYRGQHRKGTATEKATF